MIFIGFKFFVTFNKKVLSFQSFDASNFKSPLVEDELQLAIFDNNYQLFEKLLNLNAHILTLDMMKNLIVFAATTKKYEFIEKTFKICQELRLFEESACIGNFFKHILFSCSEDINLTEKIANLFSRNHFFSHSFIDTVLKNTKNVKSYAIIKWSYFFLNDSQNDNKTDLSNIFKSFFTPKLEAKIKRSINEFGISYTLGLLFQYLNKKKLNQLQQIEKNKLEIFYRF